MWASVQTHGRKESMCAYVWEYVLESACMHLCGHMYKSSCVPLCGLIHESIYMYLCGHMYESVPYIFVDTHVKVCTCVDTYVRYFHVGMCVGTYVIVCMWIYVGTCMGEFMCASVWTHVWDCATVWAHVQECASVWAYVWECACVYPCVDIMLTTWKGNWTWTCPMSTLLELDLDMPLERAPCNWNGPKARPSKMLPVLPLPFSILSLKSTPIGLSQSSLASKWSLSQEPLP